jgi:hypothetical protein
MCRLLYAFLTYIYASYYEQFTLLHVLSIHEREIWAFAASKLISHTYITIGNSHFAVCVFYHIHDKELIAVCFPKDTQQKTHTEKSLFDVLFLKKMHTTKSLFVVCFSFGTRQSHFSRVLFLAYGKAMLRILCYICSFNIYVARRNYLGWLHMSE